MCVYIYIYIYKNWLTIIEGNPKVPFSVSITPEFRGKHYSFPWIAPLILDPYLLILFFKQGSIKYFILSIWYDSTWD